jgi:hypothetical protein
MGIFARGRIAWILAMILGVVLVIVGAVMTPPNIGLIVGGVVVFLLGLIFLIISYVTKGQSD